MESPLVAFVIRKYFNHSDREFVAFALDSIRRPHRSINFVAEEVSDVLIGGMFGPQTPRNVVSRVDSVLQCV